MLVDVNHRGRDDGPRLPPHAPETDSALIQVTVGTVGGTRYDLPSLPASALVRELACIVREHLGVPISAQRLINGHEVLTDPALSLAETFGPETRAVELVCVRRQLTYEEQEILDKQLIRAAASGQGDELKELLMEGASPDAECCGGVTTLMAAIVAGEEELAKQMREAGAPEPDMTPKHKNMAEAFRAKDFVDIVKHIAAGANPNEKLMRGFGIAATRSGTPLHACCAQHRHAGAYEVAQLLIGKKADLTLGDAEGDNAVAHARYFDAKDILALLEGHGGQVAGPYFRMFGGGDGRGMAAGWLPAAGSASEESDDDEDEESEKDD